MWAVTASDLDRWADDIAARGLFPQIVRNLIWATIRKPDLVDFPAAESISRPGFDGLVDVREGNPFVPSGFSGWELSTEKKPSGKASREYKKRTADPLGLDTEATSFVFCSPRKWQGGESWARERVAEARWSDVRVIEASLLEQWLEQAPTVAVWLLELLGRCPPGLRSLGESWKDFFKSTEPELSRNLVVGSRDKAAERVRKWLLGVPSSLRIRGESHVEASAFVGAVVQDLPNNERNSFLARGGVVTTEEAWRSLPGPRSDLLVLDRSSEPGLAGRIVEAGNHVLLAVGRESPQSDQTLELARIQGGALEASLVEMGIGKRTAGRLRRDSGRSLSVLRRRLATANAMTSPAWANPEHGPKLIPALLAGAWDEAREADVGAVELLASRSYPEVRLDLIRWSEESDPPLLRSGSVWKLTAARDAWTLLSRYVTGDELERLRSVVRSCLGEILPKFELNPEERWAAAIHGKVPEHSDWLRGSLAETLALLAVVGQVGISDLQYPPQDFVSAVVRDLLQDATEAEWYSLSNLLTTLAEAAPDTFIGAVEASLEEDPPPVMSLFVEDGLLGGAGHSSLLWALELLALEPTLLSRSALVLAQLANLDPGGTYANRPASSLQEIFSPVLRVPSAANERLAVLDLLIDREPHVGWELLLALLPQGHWTLRSHHLRWRDWDDSEERLTTEQAYHKYVHSVSDRAILHADEKSDRLVGLIENFGKFAKGHRIEIANRLRRFAEIEESKKNRLHVWDNLRDLVTHYRQYPDSKSSVPASELESLAEILAALEPVDPVDRFAYLFDSEWPALPLPKQSDYREEESAVRKARLEAVRTIHRTGGFDDLLRLAESQSQPSSVGMATAAAIGSDAIDRLVTPGTLGQSKSRLRPFSIQYVRTRSLEAGEPWMDSLLERALEESWIEEQIADFLVGLVPAPTVWNRVREFGGRVEDLYWQEVNLPPLQEPSELETGLEGLLNAGRPLSAMSLAWITKERISSDLLLRILELSTSRTTFEESGSPRWFEAKTLFEELDARNDVDRSRIVRLEIIYLNLLRNAQWRPKSLHRALEDDPDFFAQVVSWLYKREVGVDLSDEESGISTEEKSSRASVAYHILSDWRNVPGQQDNGEIEVQQLKSWVSGARMALGARGRPKIGDYVIGEHLAKAPSDDDGCWPAMPIREIIEETASRNLLDGLRIGIQNLRDTKVGLGGEEEREISKEFSRCARELSARWPATATLLRDLARAYESDAHREDSRARHHDWEWE